MIAFISLFLPVFMILAIVLMFDKSMRKPLYLILLYFNSLILVTVMNLFLLVYVFGNGDYYLDIYAFNNLFSFRYLLLSMINSVTIGTLFLIIKKYFYIKENRITTLKFMKNNRKKISIIMIIICTLLLSGIFLFKYICSLKPYNDASHWLQHGFLVGHAIGEVEGFGDYYHHRFYTNSLEAFEQNYAAGYRIFEIDFSLSSDGILFTRHSEFGPFSIFEEEQEALPFTVLSFEEVAELMVKYDDFYIITDTKQNNLSIIREQFDIIYETLNRVDPELKRRIIVQVYNQDMYHFLNENYTFPFYLLTLYMTNYCNQTVIDFVRDSSIQVVTMHAYRASREFVSELREVGAVVFAHFSTPVSYTEAKHVLELGVYGIYTFNLRYEGFPWTIEERWRKFGW